jgi:hypothetical protein
MKNLLNYIQGGKKGKEAHDLERESMQNFFLKEALEGYDEIEGNHRNSINQLKKKVFAKTQKKKPVFPYWYAAASVLLLFSIAAGYYLITNYNTKTNDDIAYQKTGMDENLSEKFPIVNGKYGGSTETPGITEEIKEQGTIAAADSQVQVEDLKIREEQLLPPSHLADNNNEVKKTEDEASKTSVPSTITGEEIAYKKEEIVSSPLAEYDKKTKAENLSYEEEVALARRNLSERKQKEVKNTRKAATSTASHPLSGTFVYNQYLKENIFFKENDKCEFAKGTAIIRFSVDSRGRPQHIRVIQSLCKTIDEQLVELIKKGSDWTEGKGQLQFTQ